MLTLHKKINKYLNPLIDEPTIIWSILLMALTGLSLSTYYYSGDITIHRNAFYRLLAGGSAMFNPHIEGSYLPSEYLIFGPFIAASHWLPWGWKMFVFQLPDVIFYCLNLITMWHLVPIKNKIILPLIIFCPYSFILMAGGNLECTVVYLCLTGILLHRKGHYVYAGILFGLSFYKMITLPCLLIALALELLNGKITNFFKLLGGMILANLPNLIYFACKPDDFIKFLSVGGRNTAGKFSFRPDHPLTLLKSIPGFENWYCTKGIWSYFLILALIICFILVFYNFKNDIGLHLIAYSPIALAWQAEDKGLLFYMLCVIFLIEFIEHFFIARLAIFFIFSAKWVHLLEWSYPHNTFQSTGISMIEILLIKTWVFMAFLIILFLLFHKKKITELNKTIY